MTYDWKFKVILIRHARFNEHYNYNNDNDDDDRENDYHRHYYVKS